MFWIAPEGKQDTRRGAREMVAVPVREPSTFMAAINFLFTCAGRLPTRGSTTAPNHLDQETQRH